MRAQHVLHRLIGHALHLRQYVLVVLLELVVHQNDAFASDVDGDIAAVAFDFVKVVLDFVEGQRRRLFALVLGVSDPATRQQECARGNPRDRCSAHAGHYIKW